MKVTFGDISGPAAMPRKNGELVFQTPWESRVFGIAVTLCEQGVFEWEEFRQSLITEIGEWDRKHLLDPKTEWNYYLLWTRALEKMLFQKGVLRSEEMMKKIAQVEASWKHEEGPDHHHSS
jgi:nitrile hydratase accessory protein